MATNYNPRTVTDGLVLYLDAANPKSYPGSGTVWTDLSGNGNDGTLVNGVGYNSANNGSMVFDGSDDYVTTSNQLDPIAYGLFADSTSFWSVSSWFLPDTSNSAAGAITSKGGGIGGQATYVVWEEGTALKVRLRGGTILDITTSLTSNWNEVVITWDGTSAKAYLNGLYISDIVIGSFSKQTNNFNMGAAGGTGTGVRYLGRISDTKVYNRALSSSEIQQNFNALRGRFGI